MVVPPVGEGDNGAASSSRQKGRATLAKSCSLPQQSSSTSGSTGGSSTVVSSSTSFVGCNSKGSSLDETPNIVAVPQQQHFNNKTLLKSFLPCHVTPTKDIHNGSDGKGSISAAISSSGVLTSKQCPSKGQ